MLAMRKRVVASRTKAPLRRIQPSPLLAAFFGRHCFKKSVFRGDRSVRLWAMANGEYEQALRYAGEIGRLSWRAVDRAGEAGSKVKGVVTDGVTRVRADLEIGVPLADVEASLAAPLPKTVTITITDPKGNGGLCLTNKEDDPCKEPEVTAKLVTKDGKLVLSPSTPVYYKAPESFVRAGEENATSSSRDVNIVATLEKGKTIASSNALKRPPVILVHGVWGDGSAGKINPKTGNFEKNPNYTWKDFAPLLKKQGYDTIISVDYSAENANSFDDPEIMEKVRIAILEAIDTIRSNNLAGRKVDIVAHSMGGLVVRSFCEKEKEFCKESIRKLITIDTPHQGSELADLLLIYRDQRDKFPLASTCRIRLDKFIKGDDDLSIDPHPIDKGAVDAMAVGNPQVGILESADPLPVGKWNVLPWPASPTTVRRIAGNATN